MNRSSPDDSRRDPVRAIFLCLMVLAQLLLPSAVAQAQAKAAPGCYALGAGADSGKSSAHDHGQQCMHCRPQVIAPTPPVGHPLIAVTPAFEAAAQHAHHAIVEAVGRTLPPPTGPPASASAI